MTTAIIRWMRDYDVHWYTLRALLPALGWEEGSPAWNELRDAAAAEGLTLDKPAGVTP